MIHLRQLIEEYKSLILILIKKTKNDEDLSEEIDKSNSILKEINKLNCNDEQLKKILKEFDIPELENELTSTIKKEMVKIKKKIENMRKAKNARNMYRSNNQVELKLFEKKI